MDNMREEEMKQLRERYQELLRKTDGYGDSKEKDSEKLEAFKKELSEVSLEIKQLSLRMMQDRVTEIENRPALKSARVSEKEAKKVWKEKYEAYKALSISCRDLYGEIVKKKQEGREIYALMSKDMKAFIDRVTSW
jgi:chromosome segregation ATPase